jgi:hypothetical protein
LKPIKVEKNHPVLFVLMIAGIGILVGFIVFLFIMIGPEMRKKSPKTVSSQVSSSKSSASSSKAQSSSSSSTAADAWEKLELNQKVAIVIQYAASQADTEAQSTSILTSSSYSITGDFAEGAILMNNAAGTRATTLADVKSSNGVITVVLKVTGASKTVSMKNLMEFYFSTQGGQSQTNELAKKIVGPIVAPSSQMVLDEIQRGDYASIQGSWVNSRGDAIVVQGNRITINSGSSQIVIDGLNFTKSDGSGTMNYGQSGGYVAGRNNGASQGEVSPGGTPFSIGFYPEEVSSFTDISGGSVKKEDKIFFSTASAGIAEWNFFYKAG